MAPSGSQWLMPSGSWHPVAAHKATMTMALTKPDANGSSNQGVALGYDEYRLWRKNNGHTIWPPNTPKTTNNPFGQRPCSP